MKKLTKVQRQLLACIAACNRASYGLPDPIRYTFAMSLSPLHRHNLARVRRAGEWWITAAGKRALKEGKYNAN
jgi:hypothetical protein